MGEDGIGVDDGFGDWGDADPSEKARMVAKSMYLVLNEGQISAVDDFHHEDLDYYRSSDELGGRQDLKNDVRRFLSAFPDLEAHISDVFADEDDGNTVTIRYEIEGTHSGTFENIPPTEQRVHAKGIGIATFEGDKIAEFTLVFDNLGLLRDLGLLK
jgi:steroid delta-isomerase-like uncharacterized protein